MQRAVELLPHGPRGEGICYLGSKPFQGNDGLTGRLRNRGLGHEENRVRVKYMCVHGSVLRSH